MPDFTPEPRKPGYTDDLGDWLPPCTCKPDCPADCKGECGCERCHMDYQDFLSMRDE